MSWTNPFHFGRKIRRFAVEAAEAKVAARVEHEMALVRDCVAQKQADRLGGMDRRNHYSESLTEAFQAKGRSA